MPIDVRNFEVPETPYRQDNTIMQMREMAMQKQRYDYQLQKEKEADEWKKLNLIQDLTDLSKHQTSSDVANAIGNNVAGNVLQKYTQLAKTMSPSELQSNIQREMSGIVNGMEATKNELDNSDEALKILKQAHPELDITSLAKDLRGDILHRRLAKDSFVNPLEVPQSEIKLDDPNFLSRYVGNTKNLDEEISNPKGLEATTAAAGDPYTNVEYAAKVPSWMQANYDESKMKNGFLPRGFMPQLSIKSEELPTDFLPALKGQQRKIVTSDVHKDFMSKHPLQVIAGTRAMFPNYDQMSEGEKELAQRDFLYGKIKSLDKSQFSYKSSKTPSVSQQKFWINPYGNSGNGSKGGGLTLNEIYPRIVAAMKDPQSAINRSGVRIGTRMNSLDSDSQKLIFDAFGGRKDGFDETNTFLADKNGVPTLYRTSDNGQPIVDKAHEVGAIPQTIDVKAQVGAPEKRERIKETKNQTTKPTKKGDLDDL